MTDRELLEKAAKAAGIDWEPADSEIGKECELKYGLWLRLKGEIKGHWKRRFNPLNDNGDAFWLAVKLQLTVANEHVSSGEAYCTDTDDNVFPIVRSGGNQGEVIEEDYAATRRAIVRAAAAIGETL